MAFSDTTDWDVRTTGSDSNGGGFDIASSGTDYSQQDSPQVTYTDLVIDGTTNTKCTSAAHPFTSAHVGNIINITSGTGFTVQRVQVVSVVGSTATVDKSLGTLGSTGGNGVLGGGLVTIATALSLANTNGKQTVHIKSGTYTITGAFTSPTNLSLYGYTSTHYDGAPTRPTITTSTNGINFFTAGGNISFFGIIFTSTAGSPGHCWSALTGNPVMLAVYCKFSGFSTTIYGEWATNQTYPNLVLIGCEITSDSNSNGAIRNSSGGFLYGCYIHDNTGYGVTNGTNGAPGTGDGAWRIINCVITDNGNHGIYEQFSVAMHLWGNTLAKNGGAGLKRSNAFNRSTNVFQTCSGNVVYGNTGKGFDLASGSMWWVESRNAIAGNTGGNTVPYTQTGAISLSGDPFTNSSGKDYTLNNTAGAGALLRNLGFPVTAFGSMTDYKDAGALQHQGSAGGGMLVNPGMEGGCRG